MASSITINKVLDGLVTASAAPFSHAARARLRHPGLYKMLGLKPPHSLHDHHALIASSYVNKPIERVLVVGCNKGRECNAFLRLNAAHVDGLDVVDDTGADFSHPRISYLRSSAESIAVRDQSYDLVYSYATMEHVHDIDAAFRELVRVTRGGGVVYSLAAPLWNSRYGHHKPGIFADYPWIHLRMNEEEILSLCERENIQDPAGRDDIARHVRFMLNPKYFNKTRAGRYIEVCNSLANVKVLANKLNLESTRVLGKEILTELENSGYSREELLALAHTFIARKLA